MPEIWNDLKESEQRTFAILVVDVVDHSDIVINNPPPKAQRTMNNFKRYVHERTRLHNGKVWSWRGDGGHSLFFEVEEDETKAEEAVLCGMDVLNNLDAFNRSLRKQVQEEIKIRIAVHKGSIIYHKDMAEVVGDATINFVSHLERKATDVNGISISEEVYRELSRGLKEIFTKAREFNGKKIYKLTKRRRWTTVGIIGMIAFIALVPGAAFLSVFLRF